MDDELVLEIDITWSDKRENSVKRTLNEVSILERDMRHGKINCDNPPLKNLIRTTWNEKTRKS